MADLFGTRDADAPDFLDGPPTGDADADTDSELEGVNLDGVLGTPPSANGKVISFPKGGTTEGGMPVIGDRPKHPERISRDTPASVLADRFKGLTEADQISFMQLTWPAQRRLLKTAGLSPDADMPPSTKPAAAGPGALGKPGKATTAQAAKAAQALATATIGKAASKPAKASKGKATAKVE